jgi:hypothetical protein
MRAITLVFLLACLVHSTACYTFHVYQIGGAEGREGGNQPGTEWKHKTLHSFAWGLVRQDLPVQNCQLLNGQRFGIGEVKIETNYGYLFASAVTLGLWMPVEISWKCAKPTVPTGVLHGAQP